MNSVLAAVVLLAAVSLLQPPPRQIGIAAALQGSYAGLKTTVVAEAAKMPDADYGFRPGAMPETRTFAQVILHIAQAQLGTCASVKGVANAPAFNSALTSKADVTKALAETFAYCDEVFTGTTDENALQFVTVRLGPQTLNLTRASVLYGLLAHTSEMYGIGTVYLRAKGLVPPASEPQGRGRR